MDRLISPACSFNQTSLLHSPSHPATELIRKMNPRLKPNQGATHERTSPSPHRRELRRPTLSHPRGPNRRSRPPRTPQRPPHHLRRALAHHLLAAAHPRLDRRHRNPLPNQAFRRLRSRTTRRVMGRTPPALPPRSRPSRRCRRGRPPSQPSRPLPIPSRHFHPHHVRARPAHLARRPQRLPPRPHRPSSPTPPSLAPSLRRLHLVGS